MEKLQPGHLGNNSKHTNVLSRFSINGMQRLANRSNESDFCIIVDSMVLCLMSTSIMGYNVL